MGKILLNPLGSKRTVNISFDILTCFIGFLGFFKGILSMLNSFCISGKNNEVMGEKNERLLFAIHNKGEQWDFSLSEEKEKLCG